MMKNKLVINTIIPGFSYKNNLGVAVETINSAIKL